MPGCAISEENCLYPFIILKSLRSIGDVKLNQNQISEVPEWIQKCSRYNYLLSREFFSDYVVFTVLTL